MGRVASLTSSAGLLTLPRPWRAKSQMGSLAGSKNPASTSPRNSSESEQQISHRCHQADEVKQCENDMDRWSFHASTLIPCSFGDELLQFNRSDYLSFCV